MIEVSYSVYFGCDSNQVQNTIYSFLLVSVLNLNKERLHIIITIILPRNNNV